jgi:hypothetical protein
MSKIFGWRERPLTSIRPLGWLRAFLERQRDGLTGHLEVAGYPFDTEGWRKDALPRGKGTLASWWPFEQYGYWVDGMVRCGLLLEDAGLLRRARRQIDHVLARPDRDGYLGPASLKTLSTGDRPSERWPHAVFFRAVMADFAARPSRATLRRMIRHYASGTAPHDQTRNVCNVEQMAWLYEQTGDLAMRDLAVGTYGNFLRLTPKSGATIENMLGDERSGDHGPTYMELFKLGALLYRITGRRRWLEASINGQRKLARDHLLVDGVPSTTEHLRGIYSNAGHETCVIADYPWALGYLLLATGDAAYADGIEKACFNALPGAVTPDFRALQYFSNPNQVIAGPASNNHPHGCGCGHMTFRPNPATECCPGNVHRAMPNYVARMWMDDGRGGVVAATYGPSEVTVGGLRITEDTKYPFDETITFRFATRAPVRLRFTFRIPGWCRYASAEINGRPLRRDFAPGTFVTVDREFREGDRLDLHLPREWAVTPGPEQGASIELGPLVFALGLRERWEADAADARSTAAFPAWNVYPESPWNFALALRRGRKLPPFELVARPMTDQPWTADGAPYLVRLPARRVPGWKLDRRTRLVDPWNKQVRRGDFRFMPALPDRATLGRAIRRVETIELVPHGATCLRVAVFPVAP